MKLTFPLLFFSIIIFLSCSKVDEVEQPIVDPEAITPETALQSYLNNDDKTFSWEIKDEYSVGDVNVYELLLTSQKWREHIWKHQLTILVPNTVSHDGALLFIMGGHVTNDQPNWAGNNDIFTNAFAVTAQRNKAVVAIIRQTPKQPLYDGLVEDELISFTLNNFKKDKDYSWPLLFPMVKTAVSAMDAVQEFTSQKVGKTINDFTLSGFSKRGWTTWLTGANDNRVEAICPMVIDMLNMPVSIDYHLEAWGAYSPQIADYTELGIPQSINSPDGNTLTTMIDPYSYRENLTMPKLIFMGTNDPYWPVDAVKNYIDEIPGENYIHYVANAGHGLNGGEQALRAVTAFWNKTLTNTAYNELSYQITPHLSSATLSVQSNSDELLTIYLWSASSTDRDFRNETFGSIKISSATTEEVNYEVDYPTSGFKAFYIDMEYADSNGGTYTKSTRVYVADANEVL